MSPAMRRRTWSRKSSTRAATIAWSYLSYLYMSDHPVAGRGVGGLYRQVRANGRAARAHAVLDRSDELRVGKEGVNTCRSRCCADYYNKKDACLFTESHSTKLTHKKVKQQ